jgi:hypothetical protein
MTVHTQTPATPAMVIELDVFGGLLRSCGQQK